MRYENFALTFEDQQLLNKYHSRVHEAEKLTNDCYGKYNQDEKCKGNEHMLNPIGKQYLKQIPSKNSKQKKQKRRPTSVDINTKTFQKREKKKKKRKKKKTKKKKQRKREWKRKEGTS